MPLIEFPDVPQIDGVPDLNKSAVGLAVLTGVAAQLEKYDYLNDIFGRTQPRPKTVTPWEGQWGIYTKNGEIALPCDSIVGIEFKREFMVATHPVEKGEFASYNKIARPFDVGVTMTCGGKKLLSREAFLLACEQIQDDLELYDVVTPDKVYESVTMGHFDYSRKSLNGVSLLTVEAYFVEVRETATASYSLTKKPDGYKTQNNGAATIAPATKGQDLETLNRYSRN